MRVKVVSDDRIGLGCGGCLPTLILIFLFVWFFGGSCESCGACGPSRAEVLIERLAR